MNRGQATEEHVLVRLAAPIPRAQPEKPPSTEETVREALRLTSAEWSALEKRAKQAGVAPLPYIARLVRASLPAAKSRRAA